MSAFDTLILSDDDSVRVMTTKLLVQEFLNVPEESLELRAYALEKVLPCLSVALEHLSTQVSRSGKSFSPINWLAQYLYRNNPLHCKTIPKGYAKSLTLASVEIRRLIQAQEEKAKAAALAQAQLLAKLKEEEEILFKNAVTERRSHFRLVLGNLYERWVNSLWRDDDPKLTKIEIINSFQELSDSSGVDSHLLLGIRKVIKGLNTEGAIDTSSFENTPNYDYLINDASSEIITGKVLLKEEFIQALYQLMAGWTFDEIDQISNLLSDLLTAKEKDVISKFNSVYDVPTIPKFNVKLGPFEWIKALFDICKDFQCSELDVVGMRQIYDSLNITKILNEGNGDNEIDIIFKALSKRIVAESGLNAYLSLIEHLSTKCHMKIPQSDEDARSPRHEQLDKSLSGLKDSTLTNQQQFALIADVLRSVDFLPTGALKLIADWIKENEINDYSFTKADHVRMMTLILIDLDDDHFKIVSDLFKSKLDASNGLGSNLDTVMDENDDRSSHEQQCISKIVHLKTNLNLNVASACQIALEAIFTALNGIYDGHKTCGTIAMREISSLRGDGGELHEEEFLRIIAASKELQESILGSRANDDSIELEIFQSKKTIILDLPVTHPKASKNILLSPSEGVLESEISFVGLPIRLYTEPAIGVVNIKLEGKSNKLNEKDVAFISKAINEISHVVNDIDNRNKLINIMISACHYGQMHSDSNLEAILVDKKQDGKIGFYQLRENVNADEWDAKTIQAGTFCSSFMLPNPAELSELDSSYNSYQYLNDCFEGNGVKIAPEASFIPINGHNNEIIGILKIELKDSNIKDQLIEEGVILSKHLENALKSISEEFITLKSITNRELDAESIDEATRRSLLFPKLLLSIERKAISNLSSGSIAELKSYKRPPKSILFIIKGILYIFGKKPKELSDWNSIIKFINNDLLTDMISYDPTRIQKKIRFKRLERVFKKIKLLETGERSSPTHIFYSWLIINRELRRAAVVSRKRRVDLFSQASDANSEGGSISDDDALESDGEMVNQDEKEPDDIIA